jgi:hypothetical protein
MAKFFVTLLCLCFIFSTADAQSFYKRKKKFKRTYMAKAITGAVNVQPPRGQNIEESSFGTPEDGVEEYRSKTPRAIRKAQRKAERAARREARQIARAQSRKERDESKALGQHLVANQHYNGMIWR